LKRKINLKTDKSYRLDIGCKNSKKEGCIGIDRIDFGQEIIWDVTQGIPFPDSSTEYIYMSHFLEHIEEKFVTLLFCEIYRICKDGAIIEIRVPHASEMDAYRLAHVSYWNENRIKGISRSLDGAFKIIEMDRKGIELRAKLKVSKNE